MKKVLKICIIIFVYIVIFSYNVYAKHPYESMTKEEINKEEEEKEKEYVEFIDNLSKGKQFMGDKYGRGIFSDGNHKLIIGCSPVVYMSVYGQDIVDKYAYDLVGYGGVCDDKVLTWFDYIDKKYNTIVLWCAANDIIEAINNNRELNDEYFYTLTNLINTAKRQLVNSPMSKIVFVNIREAVPELDFSGEEYCEKYNRLAKQINKYVKDKGIKSIDVIDATDENNSEWYMHYKNKNVFMHVLNDVENVQ